MFRSRRFVVAALCLLAREPVSTRAFVVRPASSTRISINSRVSSTKRLFTSSGTDTEDRAVEDIKSMRAGEIKKELESYGVSTRSMLEKKELMEALKKARAQGLKPKQKQTSTTTTSTSTSSTSSTPSDTDSRPREERLKDELEKCKAMKASELKKELQERGVSTKSLFEKSELVRALAEARVDGVQKKAGSNSGVDGEGYAEYTNVEVLTDDAAGPRPKRTEQQEEQRGGSSPFGGGVGGMGDMLGGMGGMGSIADMLKNMGMGGAAAGADPFGGSSPFGGGANPFGGMGDAMGKAQAMMKNPKVMEIMAKAQSNPKIMRAVQECMGNPAAAAKYQNDPEVAELVNELRKYM